MLHLVLFQPEIPQNTGNIARTAAALGWPLHLIRPLGFRLSDPRLKRAGLDYWPHVDLRLHDTWETFWQSLPPGARVWAFSARGDTCLYGVSFQPGDYLLFGPETRGLPPEVLTLFPGVYIPMPGPVRSLNLAVAVGVAAYEAYRQLRVAL
ncbi:tRNA (cytidine(34)-2'-O)-methyltransferase [Thermus scotoductus]|uniref:tRNA (cytidine(34)-2'-O)-methyltransferase n=1 Tax=Thermus scotoductus TaxID=37636 RepID=UPI00242F9F0C|nr:tRNA (cytidine(34)-2'-O)-methyltransferase [Thermus scotoductus]